MDYEVLVRCINYILMNICKTSFMKVKAYDDASFVIK